MQINEFHYDNINADVNQFIEIRHNEPLKGYEVILYNGINGYLYNRTDLSSISPTTTTPIYNYTVVPYNQIVNTAGGIVLKAPNRTVLEFISYEGTFTAKNGPANGMTSIDIGVSESSVCTTAGYSLQKCSNNGLWISPRVATPGKLNRNCTTLPATKVPSPAPCGKVVPAPVAAPATSPVASPTAPVTAPVTAPAVAPVMAPAKAAPVTVPKAAPVKAPVMQPPTTPDAPTKEEEKCGLLKLNIFCLHKCGFIRRQLKLC